MTGDTFHHIEKIFYVLLLLNVFFFCTLLFFCTSACYFSYQVYSVSTKYLTRVLCTFILECIAYFKNSVEYRQT